MKYFLIFFLFLPLITLAESKYIIFNSTDDYINIRVAPIGKIIKTVHKGDFLFGITYSINDTNAKWYNAFEGVIHSGQVKVVDKKALLEYIQQVLPQEFQKIPSNEVKKEILDDNPWINNFTEQQFKNLDTRSQYNILSYNDKVEGVMWLINLINRGDYTYALNNASLFGYTDTVKWLLKNGASCTPRYRQIIGENINNAYFIAVRDALYYAVIGANNEDIVELLITHGAALNNQYIDIVRPEYVLTHACKKGNINVINLLIKNGADVNIIEKKKSIYNPSPLQIAIEMNRLDIVQLLVEAGININYSIIYPDHKANLNELPKDYAWRLGYKDIYDYLLSQEKEIIY